MMRRVWMLIAVLAIATAAGAQQQDQSKPAANDQKAETPAVSQGGEDFVIGAEDILAINVWREPEMSRVVPVRPDGKISLPLMGEFEAAGSTAKQLEVKLSKKLETIVNNPQVTVIVQEIRSQKYSITGEVNRPGTFPMTPQMTVLDAVALAGGLRDFAKPKKMYILRRGPNNTTTKIPVNYKEILNGASGQNVALQARDTIVVP
jgi:polysaccharide biosynthesis/export protein